MRLTTPFAILLTASVLSGSGTQAAYQPALRSDEQRCVVLNLSDLRSAYLIRAGLVRYNPSDNSAKGIRAQLQRHFDVVLGLLVVSTPRSIETALSRLQAADDHNWSDSERLVWRQQLLGMRYQQLRRLVAYRDRGLFPLNQGQVDRAVPIFVDAHDTACAVGQLMRWSGWANEVAAIQRVNNLVYVPDALRSAVAAWTLTSGLLWEEAALIQPAYEWPGAHDAANYEPGEPSLENNGLRFENFQLGAANYALMPPEGLPPELCTTFPSICTMEPVPGGAVPTLPGLGLLAGQGQYGSGFSFPQHTPSGTNWIAIAGNRFSSPQPSLHALNARAAENRGQMVTIRFDVSTIAPDKRINGIAESTYLYQGGFYDPAGMPNPPDATYYLRTTARDGFISVATLSIDQSTVTVGYFQKLDTEQFSPRTKIGVETIVWLRDGVALDTFLLDFNVVTIPEPASAGAAIIGVIAFGMLPFRMRRAT